MIRLSCCLLLAVLASSAWGATQVAEVVAVNPAGTIELRHLGRNHGVPTVLRFPVESPPAWRPGQAVRFLAKPYGGDWWLEQSWPLRPRVAAALADPEWWRVQRRSLSNDGPPWNGFLGHDATGGWVGWSDEAYVHGFILVPFVPESGENGVVPTVIMQAARLKNHLALTEHRDLPWLFWSMQPERDAVTDGTRWASALWGESGGGVRWVSPCEEFVSAWQNWLGLPLFQIEGQPPVHVPQFFLIDRSRNVAVRYEGWEWPLERLEKALDGALLKP